MRVRKGSPAAAGLAALLVSLPGTAAAAAVGPAANPTPRQVARALARAQASPSLWATINICQAARTGDVIGVRGQMPALGLRTTMVMTVTLDAWSARTQRFTALNSPNAVNHIPLGAHVTGLQQGGAEFPFRAGSSGLWRATVTFAWIRAGRLVGRATRTTTAGHPSADYSIPPHHSAATCQLD